MTPPIPTLSMKKKTNHTDIPEVAAALRKRETLKKKAGPKKLQAEGDSGKSRHGQNTKETRKHIMNNDGRSMPPSFQSKWPSSWTQPSWLRA
jgi:hypothetical protein